MILFSPLFFLQSVQGKHSSIVKTEEPSWNLKFLLVGSYLCELIMDVCNYFFFVNVDSWPYQVWSYAVIRNLRLYCIYYRVIIHSVETWCLFEMKTIIMQKNMQTSETILYIYALYIFIFLNYLWIIHVCALSQGQLYAKIFIIAILVHDFESIKFW